MKKSNFWSGLIFSLLGLAFLLLGFLLENRLASLCVGFGAGMGSSGIMQLVRYRKWTRPENRAAYQERMEQERIELRDERKTMLRDRSGRYAWLFGMALCAVSILAFSVLSALELVENARLVVLFLAAYLLIQYAAGVFFYRRLSQKY